MSERPADPLFGLVAYLVSSAGLTLEEAPRHGGVRLLIAASRLIEEAERVEGLQVDGFLRECKASIDENFGQVMYDYPAFVAWLDGLSRRVAEEATRRQLDLPDN